MSRRVAEESKIWTMVQLTVDNKGEVQEELIHHKGVRRISQRGV